LELADEFLADAKLSLEHSRLRSAINNAYYAMFHASQAIWLSLRKAASVVSSGSLAAIGLVRAAGGPKVI